MGSELLKAEKIRNEVSQTLFGKPFKDLALKDRAVVKANLFAYSYGAKRPINVKRRGFIFRWKSFWLGLHYSDYNKRYCLNIIPCVTFWWIGKGGKMPGKIL